MEKYIFETGAGRCCDGRDGIWNIYIIEPAAGYAFSDVCGDGSSGCGLWRDADGAESSDSNGTACNAADRKILPEKIIVHRGVE